MQWYGKPHAAVELQLEAVYGLPEVSGYTVSVLSFVLSLLVSSSKRLIDYNSTDCWHQI